MPCVSLFYHNEAYLVWYIYLSWPLGFTHKYNISKNYYFRELAIYFSVQHYMFHTKKEHMAARSLVRTGFNPNSARPSLMWSPIVILRWNIKISAMPGAVGHVYRCGTSNSLNLYIESLGSICMSSVFIHWPTWAALMLHLMRVSYLVHVNERQDLLYQMRNLPPLEQNMSEVKGSMFIPVRCLSSPAPRVVSSQQIQLKCSALKTPLQMQQWGIWQSNQIYWLYCGMCHCELHSAI